MRYRRTLILLHIAETTAMRHPYYWDERDWFPRRKPHHWTRSRCFISDTVTIIYAAIWLLVFVMIGLYLYVRS